MKQELFPEKPQADWTVRPVYYRQTLTEVRNKAPLIVKHYELMFIRRTHLRRKGEHGPKILQEMAAHMNKHGMAPRKKIECLADEGLPPLPKKTKAKEQSTESITA